MSETELNPCPYPCGWKELDRLIAKNAAWFARRTADDDVPDDVREVGINLGLWARELCEFSRDNQPRPAVPDGYVPVSSDQLEAWRKLFLYTSLPYESPHAKDVEELLAAQQPEGGEDE